jgi:hypothetical protein
MSTTSNADANGGGFELVALDLASLKSVRGSADAFGSGDSGTIIPAVTGSSLGCESPSFGTPRSAYSVSKCRFASSRHLC